MYFLSLRFALSQNFIFLKVKIPFISFLQMPRQLRKLQLLPEMPDFRNCLRHIYWNISTSRFKKKICWKICPKFISSSIKDYKKLKSSFLKILVSICYESRIGLIEKNVIKTSKISLPIRGEYLRFLFLSFNQGIIQIICETLNAGMHNIRQALNLAYEALNLVFFQPVSFIKTPFNM